MEDDDEEECATDFLVRRSRPIDLALLAATFAHRLSAAVPDTLGEAVDLLVGHANYRIHQSGAADFASAVLADVATLEDGHG